MGKTDLSKLVAVPLACGCLALAACGSSGSAKAGGSTGPTTTLPTLSASPVTLHLFLNSREQGTFDPAGKAITNPNQGPAPGDYFTDSDVVYAGTHAKHDNTSIGSAHLLCVVTAASGNTATGLCEGLIDLGGSLMAADHQVVHLGQDTGITLSVTGGTGRYQGATGSLTSANVANSNDSDLTLTVSRPSGKAGSTPVTTGGPTLTSTPQTFHYFQISTENSSFGPDGKAITDPNAAPGVGDYFVSSDEDYQGNDRSHQKDVAGTDHLICILSAVDAKAQVATGICNAAIAFGNSMMVADQQTIRLSMAASGVVVPITNGTGRYQGAHGTVTSQSVGNSNNANITLTASK